MNSLARALIGLMLFSFACAAFNASHAQAAKPQQFVYVLRVTPAFHDESKWTKQQNDAVGRHFVRLSQATDSGKVIFAGRTNESLDRTFGLVVFEADSVDAARQFMETDPAVEAGLMSATLHPYVMALQRKQ